MTVIATLERGGTTVELPLLDEAANILIAVDHAKPELITHDTGGAPFPRIQDQWSGQQNFNLLGKYIGSNAYQDAIDLVDMVLADGNGEVITLNVPGVDEIDSDIPVVPSAAQERALNLSYQPGRKNVVDFDLGLTRVSDILGSYNRDISTPTATGTGPIQLSNSTNTVDLEVDVNVSRSVGRPNDAVKRDQDLYPNYFAKRKVVSDQFDIQLLFTDNATGKTEQIAEIFSTRMGRDGFTLDFNGIYGLGEFNVMPQGGQGLRHVRDAGKEGVTIIPTITVQRIYA